MDDTYTVADIATLPCVNNLVGYDQFKNVQRVLAQFKARPAVIAGLDIPKRPT